MPVFLAVLRTELDDPARLPGPFPLLAGRLLVLLILPTLLGTAARRARPNLAARRGRTLLGVGLVALAVLIALVLTKEWDRLVTDFTQISLAVGALTVIMLGTGYGMSRAAGLGPRDRSAAAMVLAVRNVGDRHGRRRHRPRADRVRGVRDRTLISGSLSTL
jgi:predicted Na+-dependent transporter